MLNLLFALIGLLIGVVINALADDLPQRKRPSLPRCPTCAQPASLLQWVGVGACASCGAGPRWRVRGVAWGTAVLFALLPSLMTDPINLAVNSLYIAILILITVTDLEHKLIFDVVTLPATAVALLFSVFVSDNNFLSALVGALLGFVLFFAVYWVGQAVFGPGALGFGDVKLAMALGAMLGLHRVLFAITLAILLGGVVTAVLLLSRRFSRTSYLPYGQYLTISGILMLIWGTQVVAWYVG
ncbi:MAG: prepilin peptidase [Ardenticatenaceae bacterium]|nr:prepilin peptidase [Ardenticatenaceae bacterium]MCB8989745.1 prepilin peptidase [Ardenticatenaceae bacterium]MCB9002796.1 prepilin peptidase [Ardenticatenaceae bacterium]